MSQPDSKFESLKVTAFHEAGHAFTHEVFGMPYTEVKISENEEEGKLSYSYEEPIEEDSLISKLIYACICFSGPVAEDKHKIPTWTESHGYGFLMGGGGVTDWQKYGEIGLPNNYEKPLLEVTRKIINDNWLLISKIADALVENKQLISKEVKKIIGNRGLEENRQLYILELQEIPLKANNSENSK